METYMMEYHQKYTEYIRIPLIFRILGNDYDLITFENSKCIKQNDDIQPELKELVSKLKPMVAGFKVSCSGGRELIYIDMKKSFPTMKNVGIIKDITGGEYYDIEYVLSKINKCNTETYFFNSKDNTDNITFKPNLYNASITSLSNKKNHIFVLNTNDSNIKKKIKIALNFLQKKGDLFLEFTIPKTVDDLKFYHKIMKYFDSMDFIESNISQMSFIVFRTLNVKQTHDFNKFVEKINKIIHNKKKQIVQNIHKSKYIQERYDANPAFIHKAYKFLISKAMNWADDHQMKINTYYIYKMKKLNRIEILKRHFPPTNYEKLKINFTSLYSIDTNDTLREFMKIIQDNFDKNNIMLDGTAHIGCNTINFAKYFKKVIGIEINDMNYQFLKNNVGVYGLNNVKIIKGDFTKLFHKLKFDVLYLDPPWNSIYYKIEKSKDMYLSGINIVDILTPNMNFCIKIPKNFNFNPFFYKFSSIKVYNLKNISILVHKN